MRKIIPAAIVAVVLLYSLPLLGQTAATTPATAQSPSATVTSVPGQIVQPAPGTPTQSAIAVTTVPSPAAPQNPLAQVMWAGAMSYVLRYLTKKKWFPVLTPESESRFKAQVGFVVALGTAAGIHLAVNGSFFSHDGMSLSVAGLSFDVVKDVGFQWLSQQAWYDIVVKKVTA